MTSRKPNWQDEGLTPGSVLNDRDLADFSRMTDPFSERGRIRREEYQASGVHPKEFLDQLDNFNKLVITNKQKLNNELISRITRVDNNKLKIFGDEDI